MGEERFCGIIPPNGQNFSEIFLGCSALQSLPPTPGAAPRHMSTAATCTRACAPARVASILCAECQGGAMTLQHCHTTTYLQLLGTTLA
jgi:hypothetical protein